jgi:hypothetical protein
MGCKLPLAKPSIVVTSAPSSDTASVEQLFTDLPPTCTTQAPHWLVSQPMWVPVNRKFSRKNTDSNVSSGTSPLTDFPFTFNVIFVIYLSLIFTSHRAFLRPKPVKKTEQP